MTKKDFSLMIKYMEQVHEATILYGLKVIMGTESEALVDFDDANPKPKIKTEKWNSIINQFYDQFCTAEARADAYDRATPKGKNPAESSPKLNNILLRLHDFSTVVEANRAMKAGDIGCLMDVWKMWAVMSQGLKGLTNYSSYLPRMILLLTEFLPAPLAKLFRHSILFSPSGRENHFMSKDSYLELQNYWLKFVYNRSTKGTQIDRLKDPISLNIHLLRSLLHSIRKESGATVYSQSHKNIMHSRALNVVMRMSDRYDIFDLNKIVNEQPKSDDENVAEHEQRNDSCQPNMIDEANCTTSKNDKQPVKTKKTKPIKVEDSFVDGFIKIQKEYKADPLLTRFKLHMPCDPSADDVNLDQEMENPPTHEV
ncbi:hypothetical protein PGT21_006034 [Puccinia graminis f. sp. tritici]|uniref:DUF6589 domain-containing protein n=1 Tax=Puccinia graminis f. sp. tritici TaxID=56615 RepID=A0A5B0RAX6_PUCGR|nr:hypothetical protein PGT21_006034 [Puccinia graminis f. sp. tritici]KAA1122896.1 hypothetical protein PGTUg99_011233 [Puccinia graminis f. sp. tritici]